MSVVTIKDANEYNKLVNSSQLTVVLFSAAWAEQCQQILDVMNVLVKQPDFKSVNFLDVPAEDFSDISIKHQIEAVPTVLFFRDNKAIDRIDGVNIAEFSKKCASLTGNAVAGITESLNDRLKSLINKSKVMIFMKGDRVTPRCGFSRELIRILNETGVTYETFDILSNDEVRQGLKTYSDWPTYPQLYVSGELVGGLDIIKELLAGNELKETLNG